ncbi:DNA methyltransferase [Candidatus Magnetominusculus dajiuhuensis]|uniref:DNA methyltransferase n=1 Tax=Candidatus Magnetominusculus dajiuhuensis TaxID=3137712 RepID=UPI003B431AF3
MGKEAIACFVTYTNTDIELKMIAAERNAKHGYQMSNKDKKNLAIEVCGSYSNEEIAKILSVSVRTVSDWTQNKRQSDEEKRNEDIFSEYLKGWNTQEAIAERYGITKQAVSKIIEKLSTNSNIAKSLQNFKPIIYSIWNTEKGDGVSHFGAFPIVFMENLIYYHTEPMDIVYDPFAGNGTTVDVCKAWQRRYYCSDRIVKAGREDDIKLWDIANGLPNDLQKPDFVFLDPPYWKQAEKMYSEDKECLGNMSLDDFYATLEKFLKELIGRKVKRIAIVIMPTQWKNDKKYEDHIFKLAKVFNGKYEIEMRRILPYSTQQYNAQMVEKAKEEKICLVTHRDLVVWRLL